MPRFTEKGFSENLSQNHSKCVRVGGKNMPFAINRAKIWQFRYWEALRWWGWCAARYSGVVSVHTRRVCIHTRRVCIYIMKLNFKEHVQFLEAFELPPSPRKEVETSKLPISHVNWRVKRCQFRETDLEVSKVLIAKFLQC